MRGTLAILFVVAATTTCAQTEEGGEVVALAPFAASPAPLSHNKSVALVDTKTACVIESFEFRILCTNPKGVTVGAFGGEGEGPGEYLNPVHVFRESPGMVAVYDRKLARLGVFEPAGTRLSEMTLRGPFWVHGTWGARVYGEVGLGMGPSGPEVEIQLLDAASGEIVWQRSIYRIAETECGRVGSGMPRPDGGYVFWACDSELAFLDDLNGKAEGCPSYDGHDRLWVATTRDHDAFSYFEVWVGTEYAGAVRIRDRLMGYDILDSTLVALVERKPDQHGIAQRGIDWYDISEVELGRQGH